MAGFGENDERGPYSEQLTHVDIYLKERLAKNLNGTERRKELDRITRHLHELVDMIVTAFGVTRSEVIAPLSIDFDCVNFDESGILVYQGDSSNTNLLGANIDVNFGNTSDTGSWLLPSVDSYHNDSIAVAPHRPYLQTSHNIRLDPTHRTLLEVSQITQPDAAHNTSLQTSSEHQKPKKRAPKRKAHVLSDEEDAYMNHTYEEAFTYIKEHLFREEITKDVQKRFELLRILFIAIGSPDAFRQLRDVLDLVRENPHLPVFRDGVSFGKIWSDLEALNTHAGASGLLRRFFLTELVKKQNSLRSKLHQSRHSEEDVESSEESTGRKLDSLVIDKLMQEVYPLDADFDTRAKQRSQLTNRLFIGRKWLTFQEQIGKGAFALLPTGGRYKISNQSLEFLKGSDLQLLCDALKKYRSKELSMMSKAIADHVQDVLSRRRSNRRLEFEVVDLKVLNDKTMNPERLSALCKPARRHNAKA